MSKNNQYEYVDVEVVIDGKSERQVRYLPAKPKRITYDYTPKEITTMDGRQDTQIIGCEVDYGVKGVTKVRVLAPDPAPLEVRQRNRKFAEETWAEVARAVLARQEQEQSLQASS